MSRKTKNDRLMENIDSTDIIDEKCLKLVSLIKKSQCTLVYTGAGISTAASIPDYRGPKGLWTLAKQGKIPSKSIDPLSSAPTTAHIVLKELCRYGHVRHIVSQNCDGLHLRSGIPQLMLSEIHGNTNIEVCPNCNKEYIRNFDVTVNSGFDRHMTTRNCVNCRSNLVDTIVYFGEKREIDLPLNWKGVFKLIPKCDLIIVIGSSLQVLKHYKFLWPKNIKLAIINLQWTPKDNFADLKINGHCDDIMMKVSNLLDISLSFYCRDCDPVNQPRRNARLNELMNNFTDCNCHRRPPRPIVNICPSTSSNETKLKNKLPKWMTVQSTSSKATKNTSIDNNEANEIALLDRPRKRGRKRKRPIETVIVKNADDQMSAIKIPLIKHELIPTYESSDIKLEIEELVMGMVQTISLMS